MKTNPEIRIDARAALSGNWGKGIIVTIVYWLLSIVASLPQVLFPEGSVAGGIIYLLAYIFFAFPVAFGLNMTYLRFSRGETLDADHIFGAFNATFYKKSIAVNLLSAIYIFLWSLLLVVPGIIKSLSYFLAPYILIDNPSLTGEQAICQSMKMMDGHKMDLFLILLGYAGLSILSALLLFIPMLWIVPYYMTVFAKFYENVKADYAPVTVIE